MPTRCCTGSESSSPSRRPGAAVVLVTTPATPTSSMRRWSACTRAPARSRRSSAIPTTGRTCADSCGSGSPTIRPSTFPSAPCGVTTSSTCGTVTSPTRRPGMSCGAPSLRDRRRKPWRRWGCAEVMGRALSPTLTSAACSTPTARWSRLCTRPSPARREWTGPQARFASSGPIPMLISTSPGAASLPTATSS